VSIQITCKVGFRVYKGVIFLMVKERDFLMQKMGNFAKILAKLRLGAKMDQKLGGEVKKV
jgi:uncharacterized membrane-anchored protein